MKFEHPRQKILTENYFFTLHTPQRITIMPNKTERKRILEGLERTITIEQATGADSDVEMRETRLLVDNDTDNCEDSDEDFLCGAFEDSEDACVGFLVLERRRRGSRGKHVFYVFLRVGGKDT